MHTFHLRLASPCLSPIPITIHNLYPYTFARREYYKASIAAERDAEKAKHEAENQRVRDAAEASR